MPSTPTTKTYYAYSGLESVAYKPFYTDRGLIPQVNVVTQLIPYIRSYEEFTPNSEGSRKTWKSFQHYKRWYNTEPTMCGLTVPTDSYGNWPYGVYTGLHLDPYYGYSPAVFGELGSPLLGLPAFYSISSSGFVPDPADLTSLKQRSLDVMLPEVKAELSSVNSLIELKDFKSLPDLMRRVRDFKGFRFSSRGPHPLRVLLRGSSELYLQYKFNIAPLLSDIHGLYRAVSSLERRINALITSSGRLQSRHYSFNWWETLPSESLSDPYSATWLEPRVGGQFVIRRSCVPSPSVFHAEMQYNYNYTAYQIEHARLLTLLDSVGINFNPAIIWNALPWSFVVDWVLGIGRYLDSFKVSNMSPKINIYRYLWSVKRSRTVYLYRRFIPAAGLPSQLPLTCLESPLPVFQETAYKRSVGLPENSSILSSGLSSSEFSLAAALVFSRRRSKSPRGLTPTQSS